MRRFRSGGLLGVAPSRRRAWRPGRRCVKPRKSLKRKCTRLVKALSLTRAKTRKGTNRVQFSGRFGRKKLAVGRYRATLVATDSASNRSKPRRATFTVVRR